MTINNKLIPSCVYITAFVFVLQSLHCISAHGINSTMIHNNNTIGHGNHTIEDGNHTTGEHSNHTTGNGNHTMGHGNNTMGHGNHTTGEHGNHTNGHSNHTTGNGNHTMGHGNNTMGHGNHTIGHGNHTTGEHGNHTNEHGNHTDGHVTIDHGDHGITHGTGHGVSIWKTQYLKKIQNKSNKVLALLFSSVTYWFPNFHKRYFRRAHFLFSPHPFRLISYDFKSLFFRLILWLQIIWHCFSKIGHLLNPVVSFS